MKVERLGITTYTQQVEAGGSKKIRVRVGPFANKAEADKTMNTLRKAGLTAGLLTL
jgi:DedD protein